MRNVVMAMMTTLNGRLDKPDAWVAGVDDEQYADIDRQYNRFDAIIVGSTTYTEMHAYWPGALTDETGYADSNVGTNQRMAEKMNAYRKYVFTRSDDGPNLTWANSEPVIAPADDDVIKFVKNLKDQPGRDIHLAGGATLAQHFVRLGLVDRFRFLVYPLVSAGARWFDQVDHLPTLQLNEVTGYDNGVVALDYTVVQTSE
ncbi:Pyrimidine reductase, riboflavin biosynthesis [Nonomuraea solani]|uniref:Pyrimidine reductase, riboflavin biosynthesis n=1 Tax=Nonomuraea solani TaxID=1144553 RepID=A0A1H6F0W5_9ACTN|nr:dihydrofolate reductase family protein [Nonomuraea solani]SEH03692.1 Pyrimidine reductase, riboflavin biosynthesis [Nonomuraea solani]